ncbi:hypothetical protein SSAG_03814 [Streptomyces sp. Mg1]|nr:hypothetical protein SSAG_03814 [Streptomyces sp. Mg1]
MVAAASWAAGVLVVVMAENLWTLDHPGKWNSPAFGLPGRGFPC